MTGGGGGGRAGGESRPIGRLHYMWILVAMQGSRTVGRSLQLGLPWEWPRDVWKQVVSRC